KSARKVNLPTGTKTSLAIPPGVQIARLASFRVILVRIRSGKPNCFQTDSGIKLILAPRSARALHLSSLKPHEMRNFPSIREGYGICGKGESLINGFGRSGNGRSISSKSTASSNGFKFTLWVGNGTVGPSVESPLRVVMALSSPFGLAMVLPGRVPDP
nr:hypothetical protein [Tanacetum cinerariifolium]